jgi:hypothetical protein
MGSQPPTENDPKGAESEDPEAKVTRSNFESLAKGLFGVSREDLKKAEDRARDRGRKAKPS